MKEENKHFFVPFDGLSVSTLVLLLLLGSVPPRKSANSMTRPLVCRDLEECDDAEDEDGNDANVVDRCLRTDRSPKPGWVLISKSAGTELNGLCQEYDISTYAIYVIFINTLLQQNNYYSQVSQVNKGV